MQTLQNILETQTVQKLGWTLVHFTWQAAAVAVVLAIVMRWMRKSSSNLRYMAACGALILIVLMPMVTMTVVNVAPTAIETIKTAEIDTPHVTGSQVVIEIPMAEPPQVTDTVTPKTPLKTRFINTVEASLPFIVVCWFVGVFGLSLWHLGGWTQLQRLRRKMVRPVGERINLKLKELSRQMGINRMVSIMESALVQVPTVVGHFKPVILLPASALTGLTADQLEAILAHELAHIKRCDYLVNMLQTVVEILGFYHPAVWWVSRKIRIERENCCDDLAIDLCTDKLRYAKALTTMEEIRGSQLAIAATGGNLFDRIKRLLTNDGSNEKKLSWLPSFITMLLIIAIVIPTALALSSNRDKKQNTLETEMIEGHVTNWHNEPIADATVTIVEHHEPGAAGFLVPQIKTDSNGYYQYEMVDWPYRLRVERIEILDSGVEYHELMGLKKVFREPAKVDFKFEQREKGNASIEGKVVNEEGDPVNAFRTSIGLDNDWEGIDFEDPKGGHLKTYWYVQKIEDDEGRFSLKSIPAGNYLIWIIPEDKEYEWPKKKVTLLSGETVNEIIAVPSKYVLYGRVLFEDGAPAVIKPSPWPNAKTRISLPYGRIQMRGLAELDEEGYFKIHLSEREYEQIKSGEKQLSINIPTTQKGESTTVGQFPFKLLSEDRNQAGVVKVERPEGQKQTETYAEKLRQTVTVNIGNSPDGDRLTVQYAVIAVCEAAGVPYNWDKSAKLADPERRRYIEPVNIKDNVAGQALADILVPVGLLYGVDAAGVYLYRPEKAGQIQSNLQILNVEMEPVAQGKNVLYATVKNNSDEEQLFAIHIYTRSVDYVPQGMGWGTNFFEKIMPNETKRARFVYKIQGPVTENTYVRIKFYNPETEQQYDYENPFSVRLFKAGDLESASTQDGKTKPAADDKKQAVLQSFKNTQRYINDKNYEQSWRLFTGDYKKSEYQRGGLERFKKQMEPTHKLDSAFIWEKEDFVNLSADRFYTTKDNKVIIESDYKNETWRIIFVEEDGRWKIDDIVGYRPALINVLEKDDRSNKNNPQIEERTLHFPQDRSLGTVYVGQLRPLDPHWWMGWQLIGPAKGKVKVPAGQDVHLKISNTAASDLRALANLKPNDIQAVSVKTVEDAQLVHLSGLSGLKHLTLNSRQITDAGLKHIGKIPSL